MTTETIRMEPWSTWYPGDTEDDERTIVTVFTGEQWEQFGPHYDSIHDALQAIESLKKWCNLETKLAVDTTLSEALNGGDGSYRP